VSFTPSVAKHLARALTTGGNVLLLDEPSNDLDTFRKKELGVEAEQPHRIRYKPLARS
jgi:ABC-type sulfate/molybdate transport systems ATPase subunit